MPCTLHPAPIPYTLDLGPCTLHPGPTPCIQIFAKRMCTTLPVPLPTAPARRTLHPDGMEDEAFNPYGTLWSAPEGDEGDEEDEERGEAGEGGEAEEAYRTNGHHHGGWDGEEGGLRRGGSQHASCV